MGDISIDISLLPKFFGSKNYCLGVNEGLHNLGGAWIKVDDCDDVLEEKRGLCLIILKSTFELNIQGESIYFRKVLYSKVTENILDERNIEELLPLDDENFKKSPLNKIDITKLEDLEAWFLPIPGVVGIREAHKANIISLFNPPFNVAMTRVVKAATNKNKSIPAF